MPLNNFIITTEPLGEDLARSLIANDAAVVDGRFVVYYFRLTEERRLLFGGGETYGYSFPADIAGFVRGHMLKIYPQLSNVRIDHAWGGTLAITTSRLPLVRRLSARVTVSAGYSGKGVVIAPWCGKVVADAISGGDADLSLLARFPCSTSRAEKFSAPPPRRGDDVLRSPRPPGLTPRHPTNRRQTAKGRDGAS